MSCYADAARRSPLCRVALGRAVLEGDDGRRVRVSCRDAGGGATLWMTLRFATLEAKLAWWRAARDAARDAARAAGGPPLHGPAVDADDRVDLKRALRESREAEERHAGERRQPLLHLC